MPKSIISDYGGVISNSSNEEIYEEVGEEFELSPEQIKEEYRRHIVPLQKGELEQEDFWRLLAGDLEVEEVNRFRRVWLNVFEEKTSLNQEILNFFEVVSSEYGLCLLSNTTPFYSQLTPEEVEETFDFHLKSYEEGLRKPEPEFYELALEKVDSAPEEVLFIDDQEKNLEYPEELGMKTFLYEQ